MPASSPLTTPSTTGRSASGSVALVSSEGGVFAGAGAAGPGGGGAGDGDGVSFLPERTTVTQSPTRSTRKAPIAKMRVFIITLIGSLSFNGRPRTYLF